MGQSPDSTLFRFLQQNSTYRWTNLIRYAGEFQGLSYRLSNSFQSTMNEIGGGERQWKDDQRFHGTLSGDLYRSWDWEMQGNLIWFNDEQSGYFNDSRAASGGFGVRRDFRKGLVQFGGAYKQEIRRRYVDTGPTLSGRVQLEQQDLGGYITSGRVNAEHEWLGDRINSTYLTRWDIRRQFAPGVSDHLTVDLGYRKRSYYLANGVIEDRNESQQQVGNELRYRIGQQMEWRYDLEFTRRSTHIETPMPSIATTVLKDRGNYDLHNQLHLLLRLGAVQSRSFIRYRVQQNLYDTQAEDTLVSAVQARLRSPPNDNSNTFELGTDVGFRLAERDSLELSARIVQLRYNTPDTTNFDDRDEIRHRYRIRYSHLFAPGFSYQAEGDVTLGHYAYLFQERSAENYWNRIFRLSNIVLWERGPWYLRTKGEVVANYYDYDYDDLLGQVRSLVFRHLILQQIVRHSIWNRWDGQLRVELQLEDQGRLDWDEFLAELILERETVEYEYRIGLPVGRTWEGYAGYRYQRRLDWQISPQSRELSERLVTQGPIFQLMYTRRQNPVITWEGAFLRVQQLNGETYPITQLRLQAHWLW